MISPQTKNDPHGLAGRSFDVPPSVPRPQSALDFERKGGVAIDMEMQNQRAYWLERQAQYKSMGESRKNRKRKDAGGKTA